MATWTTYGVLQNGTTLQLNATDHIWVNGTAFGLNIVAGQYQDSTHISDSNDIQRDTTSALNNIKYVTSSTVSVNGGQAVTLSGVTNSQVPLKFNFSDGSAVATSAAKFYAYDGVTDANPMVGITFQAAEVGDTAWTAANGSGSALALNDQGAATSHDFYVAFSASPSSPGAKSGSIKLSLTYV